MSYATVGALGIEPSQAGYKPDSVIPFGPAPVPTLRIELSARTLSEFSEQPALQSARKWVLVRARISQELPTVPACAQEEEGRIERHGD